MGVGVRKKPKDLSASEREEREYGEGGDVYATLHFPKKKMKSEPCECCAITCFDVCVMCTEVAVQGTPQILWSTLQQTTKGQRQGFKEDRRARVTGKFKYFMLQY